MSKILFAVVAAVCAFQVMTASPVFEFTNVEDYDVENKVEPLAMDMMSMPEFAFDSKWLNATAILEGIEKLLAVVQQTAEEIAANLENAVKAALDKIEEAAVAQADRWNATINDWVQQANDAGVDVVSCLEENNALELSNLADELRAEAKDCVADQLDKAVLAVKDVRDLVPVGQQLVADTRQVVEVCAEEENVILNGVCLAKKLPYMGIRAGRLAVDSLALSARAAGKIAAIAPMASICATRAAANKGVEATKIVKATTDCIREKLGASN